MPTIDGSAESVATTLADTAFVRVICRSDGDPIAAAGLLARALRRENTPFQIRADQFGQADPTINDQDQDQDDDCCIALGLSHPAADININPVEQSVTRSVYAVTEALSASQHASTSTSTSASASASASGSDTPGDVSREDVDIDADTTIPPTDTLLAVSGIVTTGVSLEAESVISTQTQEQTQTQSRKKDKSGFATALLETIIKTDTISIDQHPGVGIPVSNIVDGLAHSTLIHASFSGDIDATRAMIAEIDIDVDVNDDTDNQDGSTDAMSLIDLSTEDQRTIASAVTIDVIKTSTAAIGTAISLERALHPQYLPDGPMTTIEGYADVLRAVSRERPGTAIALAISHDANDAALTAWREHAQAVHHILETAHTGRYDGVYVLRCYTQDENESQGRDTAPNPNNMSDTVESGTAKPTESINDTSTPGRLLTVAELASRYQTPEPLVLALGKEVVAVATQPTADTQSSSTDVDAVAVAEALRTTVTPRAVDNAGSQRETETETTDTPAEYTDDDDSDDADTPELTHMQHGWVGNANQALVRVDSTIPTAEIIAIVRELTREES
jgi:hypothetical protein